MLRHALVRGARCSGQGLQTAARRQWQPQRVYQPFSRAFADGRVPDKIVLPGSHSEEVAGIPQTPILRDLQPIAAEPQTEITPELAPRVPPTPAEVNALKPASPAPSTSTAPPPASTTPPPAPTPPPPTPKRRPRRFRNFLVSLLFLAGVYGGGVYYALNNDTFYDFFTEYIPFAEDSVAYFEEREYKRRFPSKEVQSKNWPQLRGENKVTIGKSSGMSPHIKEEAKESDLGTKGRHLSALEENSTQHPANQAQRSPGNTTTKEKSASVESAKKGPTPQPEAKTQELLPKDKVQPAPTTVVTQQPAAPKPAVQAVDHINVSNADEPVVQALVKMVNNIITAVNASPEAGKYGTTINSAKADLANIVSEIGNLKSHAEQDAQTKIQSAHSEFDTAAKELVRRLEQELREQEAKWREEYEGEREKLSQSYQNRLAAELEAAKRVAEEKTKNNLLQQEIALQKRYQESVRSHVEEERNGRLAKLEDLSASVSELEKLTGQWNEVIDATQRTQHLQVALESLRNSVLNSEHPTPFVDELVALKQVSGEDSLVGAAIASINPAAYQRGLPSPAALIDRFRRVASEVRKASLLPEDAGVASHAASAVLSRVMFSKKSERGLPEGDDVEATLSRTEVLLEEGDLESAVREMNALKGWAGVLSRDWIGETRRVLEVRQAVDVIATEARLQSLLVD